MRDNSRSRFKKLKQALAIVGTASVLVFGGLLLSKTQAVSSARDCDANAVMRCGALSAGELQQKYNQRADTQALLADFGISSADISAIGSTAVMGSVTRSGGVYDDHGRLVATGAMTAGRQNISGSTPISAGGTTFYERSPSVSFASSPLSAFVVMGQNGQFRFAVLTSCGNPVTATPVAPKPHPQPTPPPSTTNNNNNNNSNSNTNNNNNSSSSSSNQQQQQQQQQSVVNNNSNSVTVRPTTTVVKEQRTVVQQTAPQQQQQQQQTGEQQQPEQVAVTPTTTTLPNTGPGSVFEYAGLATIGGTIGHFLFTRRRHA